MTQPTGQNNNLDTSIRPVSILLDVLAAHGVREIVCSPGSRDTPLLIGVDSRDEFRKTIIVDERVAAFIALGKAIVSRKPVALICTSGTAALNYAPALAEAYYQRVPLIAITADRPAEWIDQDDSQTIRQQEIFHNFIKGSYDIISGREDTDFLWYVNRIVNEGMIRSLNTPQGPVHFNIRLSDPLGKMTERIVEPLRKVDNINPSEISRRYVSEIAQRIAGKKILVVAGFHSPDAALQKAVSRMSYVPNVVVKAETISNLNLPSYCYSIDTTLCRLNKNDKEELSPDVLISIGGAPVSRMLKEWLREYPPGEHWSFSNGNILADCYKCMSHRIEGDPAKFLSMLSGALIKYSFSAIKEKRRSGYFTFDYRAYFNRDSAGRQIQNDERLKKFGWTDLIAYDILLKNIPEDANLFISNGTAIRYAQILTKKIPHATYCNRGVSGIDGSTSTALGGASVYDGPTILLSGDMSFAYDLGAIGSRLADGRLRVVVVNNGGGGIFRFINTTSKLPQLKEYFCADPEVPIKVLSSAYGWEYYSAENADQLEKTIGRFMQFGRREDSPRILEIKTPPEESAETLRKFLFRD
ncbi:MAG: 2-succinyl-5-enolpyruvyl-6-hydroxy-3-cyclohexene-1-carboxylic-acid synthase [Clostridium sp.]|nr:2-succinyl-5-enolpyruvyl-6-hydroxy-3-cyclohexene-1-carboxylic-acid synthase [Prevotella sp.]MCM1428711.1 2-succinyl-5-enolpyruvyl-6-hydroxy-3-cyclohexene-1-carboxylic-acid synthase [Clostridium sp.]MCM1475086.1 2-succinyl-5-enolpyruvyl-6-hydroxy-3-cyclohexene-1-carboxylic-acid synthase [Muribaculaceae bacterium]